MFLGVMTGNKKKGPLGHTITFFSVAIGLVLLILAVRLDLLEKIF